jgi:adiponectin receptor
VNIWSHLLGAILFVILAGVAHFRTLPYFSTITLQDRTVFTIFFTSAIACLAMSCIYHTITCHSEAVGKFGNKLDYLGIVFLTAGSFVPSIYYGFYCHKELRYSYWTMISVFSIVTALFATQDRFRTPQWRPVRAGMFILLGLSAIFPILHACQKYSFEQLADQMGLRCLISQGLFYITGASLYALRIPERFSPGTFDIWGSSHQLFHIFVVLAALTHYYGLLQGYFYWHNIIATTDLICP